MDDFKAEVKENIKNLGNDKDLQNLSNTWIRETSKYKYSYNFRWLGRPIIQFPQDILAMQEIIGSTKPDLIIETGIAHGGSLIFSASMLALLDLCDAASSDEVFDPKISSRKVLGIDIDIRSHNRTAIESHPLSNRIEMLEGSSIDPKIIEQVYAFSSDYKRILVCLDSNHTRDHVFKELEAYAPLATVGSYCVVFDTIIEDMPENFFPDRPWKKGNNPKTAVYEFLKTHPEFEIDKSIPHKLLITVAPDGYLKKIR